MTPPQNSPTTSVPRSRAGYPLSALFILITLVAILAAMLSPLARSNVDGKMLLASIAITSLCGVVLGAMIGACYRPAWIGSPLGALTGLFLGLLIGPLAQVPVVGFSTIFAACAGGAVAIVIMGVFMRLAERRRELPDVGVVNSPVASSSSTTE